MFAANPDSEANFDRQLLRDKQQTAASRSEPGEFQDVQLILLGTEAQHKNFCHMKQHKTCEHMWTVWSLRIFTQKPEHLRQLGPMFPSFSPAHKAEMAAACWNRRPYQVKSTESDRTVATPKRNLHGAFLRFFMRLFWWKFHEGIHCGFIWNSTRIRISWE